MHESAGQAVAACGDGGAGGKAVSAAESTASKAFQESQGLQAPQRLHAPWSSQTPPVPLRGVRRVAAIDIGTVTCRMLVADVDEVGRLRELTREYAIANLGEGVDATHRLKPEAIDRVAEIVERYLAKLKALCATEPEAIKPRIVAIATSASRDAENSTEFTSRLHNLGVDVRVIPGELEAALSFTGATAEFPGERVVVVDVGGGSTEVVAGSAGESPELAHSFDIGCRRITERFLASDPPTADEISSARRWMRKEMEPYFGRIRAANPSYGRMIAVAGTATTMVSIRESMAEYDSGRVHKARISREDLDKIERRLATVPLAARKNVIGLDPGRAPVIVAGCLILQTIMDLLGTDSFTVSESDILQGIVLRMTAD